MEVFESFSSSQHRQSYGLWKTLSVGLIIAGILYFIQFHWSRRHIYKLAYSFTGPRTLPVVGNAMWFTGGTREILNNMIHLYTLHGPNPFKVWLGYKLFFAIMRPQDMEIILNNPKTLEKDELYALAKPHVGEGLFTSKGLKWKAHRKIIMPTFNQKILDGFTEVFIEQTAIMVNKLKSEVGRPVFEIFDYISPCTLDIICETAMGVSVNAQADPDSQFIKSTLRIMELVFTRMFQLWLHPEFIFNRTSYGKEQKECLQIVHKYSTAVVIRKREEYHRMKEEMKRNPNFKPKEGRKAFLDLLIELTEEGEKWTNEELREEVDTMMIAGNDTSATVACFTFLLLSMHPEIQDKVVDELRDIYGTSKRAVTADDLPHMNYIEQVIKESMRLFPVGPVIVRAVSDDLQLTDCVLPGGTSIVLGIYPMHRDKNIWGPNADKFDPDHFLPENISKRHPYCYVPFSGGIRNCVGIKYAMRSLKIIISEVMRNFILKPQDGIRLEDIKIKQDVIIKSVHGWKIKIENRPHL